MTPILILDDDIAVARSLGNALQSRLNTPYIACDLISDARDFISQNEVKVCFCALILRDGTCADMVSEYPAINFMLMKSVIDPTAEMLGVTGYPIFDKPLDVEMISHRISGFTTPGGGFKRMFRFKEGDEVEYLGHPGTVKLTKKEMEIFEVLLSADGVTVSREKLNKKLYDQDWSYGDRRVDVHVSKIRKKLVDITNGSVTIKTMRSEGYKITD